MKHILLIFFAVLVANLTMAQFEKAYQRNYEFESVEELELVRSKSAFNASQLLTQDYRSIMEEPEVEIPIAYTVTFDEEGDDKTWSYAFSHDKSLAPLDWKIGTQTEDVVPGHKMEAYFGNKNVADYSKSGKNFAYYNAISFAHTPNLKEYGTRCRAHLTIGAFDFSDIVNPTVRWTQLYQSFNYDKLYIEYSTDNVNFTRIRVNDKTKGFGQIHDNLVILPKTLAKKEEVYLRFTFLEMTSVNPNSGGGYGWQIDDIQILDNTDYEIKIGKIATSFIGRLKYDKSREFHTSSTYMRVPREDFAQGTPLAFGTTFENLGSEPVNPKLQVVITDPNNKKLYDKDYVLEGPAVPAGGRDTIIFPISQEDHSYFFTFPTSENPDPEIPIGKYKIKFSISIPDQDEFNKKNNTDSTYFEVTDNLTYSRDGESTAGRPIGTSMWDGGKNKVGEVGVLYTFQEPRTIYSADVFISEESLPGNSFSMLIYRVKGEELLYESKDVTLTEKDLGKWMTINFENTGEIDMDEGIGAVYVMAKMKNDNPDDKKSAIFFGSDPTTKASYWGIKWRHEEGGSKIFSAVSSPEVGLCMRINCKKPTSILEQKLNAKIDIYPNPANDYLNIESSELIKYVEVLSMMGTKISTQNVNDYTYSYPTQELSNANYIIRIHTDNNVDVKQFSVVK